jgi:hypothetical protein
VQQYPRMKQIFKIQIFSNLCQYLCSSKISSKYITAINDNSRLAASLLDSSFSNSSSNEINGRKIQTVPRCHHQKASSGFCLLIMKLTEIFTEYFKQTYRCSLNLDSWPGRRVKQHDYIDGHSRKDSILYSPS